MVLLLEYVKAWGVHGKEYIWRGVQLSPTIEIHQLYLDFLPS